MLQFPLIGSFLVYIVRDGVLTMHLETALFKGGKKKLSKPLDAFASSKSSFLITLF